MSLDRLIEKIEKTQNPSVAGLDPKLAYVPEYIKEKCFEKYGETLKGAAKALLEFNKGLIDALYDIVPAVKPQAAYYEMYGPGASRLSTRPRSTRAARVCTSSPTASATTSAPRWRHTRRLIWAKYR